MKRDVIVGQLFKEGFSEKTLVNFNDKQLSDLHERIVVDADKLKTDPKLQALAKDPNTEVEVKEELKGNQKKLDKNHNGKIDGQDFKILRGQKKEISEDKECKKCGCTKSECKCEKCKKCDCTKSECKCKKSNVKEWVESLAENNFHSFTSKNEIMELIQSKLNESEVMEPQHGANVKKGHNGIPEFMTYDAIVGGDTKTAPAKPKVDPGTKPAKPRTPFQPGPRVNPKPKALKENK
jgi:hypothetical protein